MNSMSIHTVEPKGIRKKESIFLIHGLIVNYHHMEQMGQWLSDKGYKVYIADYPSTKASIEAHITNAIEKIKELKENNPLHMVGHSLGGIIIKGLLNVYRPKNLGRVVCIGSPFHGSNVSRFFKHWSYYKKITGVAGQELAEDIATFPWMQGKIDYPLGRIIGTNGISIFAWLFIGQTNDGKVSKASTQIDGIKESIDVWEKHHNLPKNQTVIEYTECFLKTGHFNQSL